MRFRRCAAKKVLFRLVRTLCGFSPAEAGGVVRFRKKGISDCADARWNSRICLKSGLESSEFRFCAIASFMRLRRLEMVPSGKCGFVRVNAFRGWHQFMRQPSFKP